MSKLMIDMRARKSIRTIFGQSIRHPSRRNSTIHLALIHARKSSIKMERLSKEKTRNYNKNSLPVRKIKALIEKFEAEKADWVDKGFCKGKDTDSTKAYSAAATLDSIIAQLKQLVEEV